jgi:hypothetical protein
MTTSAFVQEDFAQLVAEANDRFPVRMPFKYSLPTERWLTENFGDPFISLTKGDSGDVILRINREAKWDWRRETLFLCDEDRMNVFVTLYLKGR